MPPSAQRQGERIASQFTRLQEAMERHAVALQGNTHGLLPEITLVIETYGPVSDFIKAVGRIRGLEWLAELELPDLPAEDGFQDPNNANRGLDGSLFLVMADQRALREIQTLFRRWQDSPDARFPTGLAPLRQAFRHLRSIRPWGAEDRIRDTGLLEDWKSRVEVGQEQVPFEVELWFRDGTDRRQMAESWLRDVIGNSGGNVTAQCVVPDIRYHALIGRIPAVAIPSLASEPIVQLLRCEDVMYLRPVGQCSTHAPESPENLGSPGDLPQGPVRGPLVALLDGMPLTGHAMLDGRVVVDDPDGFETSYQARDRVHGTAMASLICHGDIDAGERPVDRLTYVRPIMKPEHDLDGRPVEKIPEEVLPVDIVHRAVRRLHDPEGEEPPAAPSVRVINLSVCDAWRPFDGQMSALARLVDWLSARYGLLFLVSAGNHARRIELQVPRDKLANLGAAELEEAVIEGIVSDTRHRRLLSPAETCNGLTIAAAHSDSSRPPPSPNVIDPLVTTGLPSTISAHGPGFRRAVKPEILLPGGRQPLVASVPGVRGNAALDVAEDFSRAPGLRVATPGPMGDLSRTTYSRGTSSATAIASRWAVVAAGVVDGLRQGRAEELPEEYDAVLLKALLVHGAEWGEAERILRSVLSARSTPSSLRERVGRFLGYGVADVAKTLACTEQRVTVIGVGSLNDRSAHEYLLPLPPCLAMRTDRRRLTVTLAWITPVQCRSQRYRVARLWFTAKNELASHRLCADDDAVRRGTVQHEVFEGADAAAYQDGDEIVVKVNCRSDADKMREPVRYGIVVTIEVAERLDLPVYNEVKERLGIRVAVPRQATP